VEPNDARDLPGRFFCSTWSIVTWIFAELSHARWFFQMLRFSSITRGVKCCLH